MEDENNTQPSPAKPAMALSEQPDDHTAGAVEEDDEVVFLDSRQIAPPPAPALPEPARPSITQGDVNSLEAFVSTENPS